MHMFIVYITQLSINITYLAYYNKPKIFRRMVNVINKIFLGNIKITLIVLHRLQFIEFYILWCYVLTQSEICKTS